MAAVTNYGALSQRTAAYAAKEMLAHAEPILCLSKFGQALELPKNTADTIKFRRPVPFAAALTPLTEGATPSGKTMSYQDITVQLQQYGDVVTISDKIMDMAEDPVLKNASMLCGEQAAETIEQLTWGVIKGGTSVFYTNGTARNAVNTALTLGKIQAAVRALKAQRAREVTSMVSASTSFNTTPVAPAFIAFGHTDLEYDVRELAGFVPAEQYGKNSEVLPHEIGKVQGVRFVLSPVLTSWADAGGSAGSMKSTSGTSADVYPLVIVAKDSYGLVALKGSKAITPMVLNPGVPRGGDPLGQQGTVGWKTYFAAARLNETWMTRIECAATNL